MTLKQAILLSVIVSALYLFVCWMTGYNFDSRGPAQGSATCIGIALAAMPFAAYFILKK
jgi:hypothetical protein